MTALQIPPAPWSPGERRLWRPPKAITVSQWSELHRSLRISSRPGPFRIANAPYLRGFMDLPFFAKRRIHQLNVMKSAQIGFSEALRSIVGWMADQHADPIMLTLPDRDKGRDIIQDYWLPMFNETRVLAAMMRGGTSDLNSEKISLVNGFTIRLAWSHSPASMATHPARVVINDEVDKFPSWIGDEADPIRLTMARTMSYQDDRLQINVSTPTTSKGLIANLFDQSPIKLYFYVPCPHCRVHQRLTFAQLRWGHKDIDDRIKRAALVTQDESAWYECESCMGEIHERDKPRMIRAGVWASPEQSIDESGRIIGDWPPGDIVGMHIGALNCLWIEWHRMAATFIRAAGDIIALQDFYNNWLGEPFEDQESRADPHVLAARSKDALPEGVIPRWAARLVASADCQKDHFYWVVRAWSTGFRSHRVAHGRAESLDQLRQFCLNMAYRFEDDAYPAKQCDCLAIDSGGTRIEGDEATMTERVYQFAGTDRRIVVVKGDAHPTDGLPLRIRNISMRPRDKTKAQLSGVKLFLVNTGHIKDLLVERISATDVRPNVATGEAQSVNLWSLNARIDPDYNSQVTSEHCVRIRKGSRILRIWKPITGGAPNHYLDSEVYNYAMAYMLRIDLLPPEPMIESQRQTAMAAQKQKPQRRGASWMEGAPM